MFYQEYVFPLATQEGAIQQALMQWVAKYESTVENRGDYTGQWITITEDDTYLYAENSGYTCSFAIRIKQGSNKWCRIYVEIAYSTLEHTGDTVYPRLRELLDIVNNYKDDRIDSIVVKHNTDYTNLFRLNNRNTIKNATSAS